MANKKMFKSATRGKTAVPANTINEAGGRAFALPDKHALAQFAATGTFNDAFYASGIDQLAVVLDLLGKVDVEFVAKTAIYVRERGGMKDMPAALCAHLTTRGPEGRLALSKAFPRVINNGKMLRNFVQIIRSGVVGRKSFGTAPMRLLRQWFKARTDEGIFWASIGNDPSMKDILKMVRPKPETASRRALYGYLTGQKVKMTDDEGRTVDGLDGLLPELVLEYERFKMAKAQGSSKKLILPKVPWEMLEGLALSEADWVELSKQATWTQTRMNLNTFARHGVFKNKEATKLVIEKLRNPQLIEKANPFPYQLLAAFINTTRETDAFGGVHDAKNVVVPVSVANALQDAMELATKNVPVVDGNIVVCPDVSGSMSSPITGIREGATTKMRCIDIAALVASVFLRKNPETRIIPFEGRVVPISLNGRDSIMTNAAKLAAVGGGSTDCSAPLRLLNQQKGKVDLVVFISDSESWVDSSPSFGYKNTTGTLAEWNSLKARNPKAKMVCIDIQANRTVQAPDQKGDILNIGGFSDSVFEQVSKFVSGTMGPDHWIGVIEAIELGPKVEMKEEADVEGP